METLKTLKGSKIGYSKYGVGKQMGSKIYVHKNYALDIIPMETLLKAEKIFINMLCSNNHHYNCVCYDTKKPNIVRFDSCPEFDTEREPYVGWQYYVDISTETITVKFCQQIFHHKWLWVYDDYNGFDVQAAHEWSKTWLHHITSPSGYIKKWNEELRKYDLPIDEE